jgi:hypothetical protein
MAAPHVPVDIKELAQAYTRKLREYMEAGRLDHYTAQEALLNALRRYADYHA